MARKIKNYKEYVKCTENGLSLYNEKKYEEALVIFLDLAEYNGKNYRVFEKLTQIYLRLDNIPLAEEVHRTARKLFSEQSGNKLDTRTFNEIVDSMEDLETLESLYNQQTEAYAKDPEDVEDRSALHKTPVMMGMHYMARGEFKKAEEMLVSHKKKYFSKWEKANHP